MLKKTLILLVLVVVLINIVYALPVTVPFGFRGARNSTGSLVLNETVNVTIWDKLSGGNVIYQETFSNRVINGSFSATLGSNGNLNLFQNTEYYYDFSINGTDYDFYSNAGAQVERLRFTSPVGQINFSDVNASNLLPYTNQILTTVISTIDSQKVNVTNFTRIFGTCTGSDKVVSVTRDGIVCDTDDVGSAGVTSVGGTAPIASSGGATPSISLTPCTDGNFYAFYGSAWTCFPYSNFANASEFSSIKTTLANWNNASVATPSYTYNGSRQNETIQELIAYSNSNTGNDTAQNATMQQIIETLSGWTNISATPSYTSNGTAQNLTIQSILSTLAGWINVSATPSYTPNGTAQNETIQLLFAYSNSNTGNDTALRTTIANWNNISCTANNSAVNLTVFGLQSTLAGWTNVSATPSYTANGSAEIVERKNSDSAINLSLGITQSTLAGWTNITATPSGTENMSLVNASDVLAHSRINKLMDANKTTNDLIILINSSNNDTNTRQDTVEGAIAANLSGAQGRINVLNDTKVSTNQLTISCLNITGGSDGDYCADAIGGGVPFVGNISVMNITDYLFINGTNFTNFQKDITSNASSTNLTVSAHTTSIGNLNTWNTTLWTQNKDLNASTNTTATTLYSMVGACMAANATTNSIVSLLNSSNNATDTAQYAAINNLNAWNTTYGNYIKTINDSTNSTDSRQDTNDGLIIANATGAQGRITALNTTDGLIIANITGVQGRITEINRTAITNNSPVIFTVMNATNISLNAYAYFAPNQRICFNGTTCDHQFIVFNSTDQTMVIQN